MKSAINYLKLVQTANRPFDEMLCLLLVMLFDKFVLEYKSTEYTPIRQGYDGTSVL